MATPDSTTDFDFLPKLPKANLDDRAFEDLVEECLLRIPRYCPEWTNYNPGDPGVTLIELFAWLVHQMLYRFNQVPRRHYVAFLELLGIRLLPPSPAQAELTFYLTQAQVTPRSIPQGTEVATVRTETQEAVIFTTDRDLTIGRPQIKHLLFAHEATSARTPPDLETLSNPFRDAPFEQNGDWSTLETTADLLISCQPGNCFYLVLDANPNSRLNSTVEVTSNDLAGNVLALTFKGPAAVTTGINPNNPPLEWQVWDGYQWQSGILRSPTDDQTKGFSFDQLGQSGPNPEQEGANIILHLPQQWPIATWGDYRGRWIRCVYTPVNAERQQYEYQRSPEITGLSARTIGGVVSASECVQLSDELIGTSNGKPGQTFQLSRRPILSRRPEEYLDIRLPNGLVETWQEVSDFGDSTADDTHYTIDDESGMIQFGPLIREPYQLRQQTQERSQVQSWGRPVRVRQSLTTVTVQETAIPAVLEAADRQPERQYGKVPPMGAEIYMRAYRTGGGSQGNVQAGRLTVLKSSMPYVKKVTNYVEATGGREAESLEEAMIRVPALLRTRETALTPEEFEHKASRFQDGTAVARSHCVTADHLTTPGVIRLLIVPTLPNYRQLTFEQGLSPERLQLSDEFQRSLKAHLDQHRALGIRVSIEAPEYIGIKVQAQVYLKPQYIYDRATIASKIKRALYRFLNPLVGGVEGHGWPRGRSVESSDVIALIQHVSEVHSVAQVQLFALRPYRYQEETGWMQIPIPQPKVELGELAIAIAWEEDSDLNPGHEIEFLDL
ncbi:putative baseplate assembly protein [Oscillatoria sp. CS-180]|uniref:putative baseplate assembly protein n=1 Tax=Oscillatoria sp. CS-180 TaxID=3021720 RepID=UPI00232D3718|nr:putative baseplate assembly protein [Oscillatoria sp. CS-180]MDB9526526.1 putative baseplate assembly protein [Oscillatoria sp. CS-180]